MYKLLDWVDETRLTNKLSCNERAVEYLENHEYLIDDFWIFQNENAIHIIEKRIMRDKYCNINFNKNAVNFLRNNHKYIRYDILCGFEHGMEFVDELIENNELDKIKCDGLSRNPAAMYILNEPAHYIYSYFIRFLYNKPDMICYKYIDWKNILYNKNAVELVKNNLHMVEKYWSIICMQSHLIDIIEENMDKIFWDYLSANYNAIHILEKNLDNIDIYYLCYNKNGFQLLLQLNHVFDERNNYDKNILYDYFDYCEKNNIPFNLIRQLSKHGYTEKHMEFLKHNNDYRYLSANPNIFEYDYKRMRETRQSLLWYNDIKK